MRGWTTNASRNPAFEVDHRTGLARLTDQNRCDEW